jgi:hypothetical protein
VRRLSANRQRELSLHPTVKPVAMIVDAIKDVSSRSGLGSILAWDCSIEPSITGRVFFSGKAFSDDCSPAREAAMAAFAKSWRRELKESPGCAGASRPTKGDTP